MADDEEVLVETPVNGSDFWKKIVAGDDWKFSLEFFADALLTPENTTGWTSTLYVKRLDGTIIYTLTSSPSDGIVNTTSLGRFDYTLSAARTALLTVQDVNIVVKVTDAAAVTETFFEGKVDVYYP